MFSSMYAPREIEMQQQSRNLIPPATMNRLRYGKHVLAKVEYQQERKARLSTVLLLYSFPPRTISPASGLRIQLLSLFQSIISCTYPLHYSWCKHQYTRYPIKLYQISSTSKFFDRLIRDHCQISVPVLDSRRMSAGV